MLKSISSTNLIGKSCSLLSISSKGEFDCNEVFLESLVMRAVRTVAKKFLYRGTGAPARTASTPSFLLTFPFANLLLVSLWLIDLNPSREKYLIQEICLYEIGGCRKWSGRNS